MIRVAFDTKGRLIPMGELKSAGPKDRSATNLRKLREFHRAYTDIRQALSVESPVIHPPGSRQTLSVDSVPAFMDELRRRGERDTDG